jgi:hypothetical protein
MRFLFFLLLLIAPPLLAATLVLHDGKGNTIRLYDSPCVHAGILGLIPAASRSEFKKAQVLLEGKQLYACWTEDADGDPLVLLEDGRGAAFYRKSFKDDIGV